MTALQEVVDDLRRTTGAPAVLAARRSSDTYEQAAAGATAGSAFRIASVTKLFVATTALRLVERGDLRLTDSLPDVMPKGLVELLAAHDVPVGRITVDHLMTHTSGLPDHADAPEYASAVWADPSHRWTRAEQVELACRLGPVAVPGELVSYSDTGYVLLGAVLEQVGARPLPALVRELCAFEQLGLRSTWWEGLEPAVSVPRLEQLVDGRPTSSLSPTIDLFGGGGLISTTADLTAFVLALECGQVLDPVGLGLLHAVPDCPTMRPGSARGAFRYDLAGTTWWGHGGFWGVLAAADAQSGAALALCITEQQAFADLDRPALLARFAS